MDIRIRVIIAIFVIVVLLTIVNMVRNRKLELKYVLSWLAVGVGILVLDIFPSFLNIIAKSCGVFEPINMLFFLGFCFSLTIIFTLTVTVSRMSLRIKELSQEIALFEERVETDRTIKENVKSIEM